jgi:hypothetical protein
MEKETQESWEDEDEENSLAEEVAKILVLAKEPNYRV